MEQTQIEASDTNNARGAGGINYSRLTSFKGSQTDIEQLKSQTQSSLHSQKQNSYNTLQSSVVSENKGPFFR
jgi:hypothetical protein